MNRIRLLGGAGLESCLAHLLFLAFLGAFIAYRPAKTDSTRVAFARLPILLEWARAQRGGSPIDLGSKPRPAAQKKKPAQPMPGRLAATLSNPSIAPDSPRPIDLPPSALAAAALSTGSADPVLVAYLQNIRSRVSARLDYPESLRRRRIQGHIELRLSVLKSGALDSAEVLSGSSPGALQDLRAAALKAARAASPFPAWPKLAQQPSERLTFRFPIDFRIR